MNRQQIASEMLKAAKELMALGGIVGKSDNEKGVKDAVSRAIKTVPIYVVVLVTWNDGTTDTLVGTITRMGSWLRDASEQIDTWELYHLSTDRNWARKLGTEV